MRKRKIILWAVCIEIVLNLLFLISKERLLRVMALKLSGVSNLVAADINPEEITIHDFGDIPCVTQEYVNAYKLFLKAKVCDKDKNTYDKAAEAFEKIAKNTKNPELKLRSLFMVTLCNFLEMKIDSAYKNGMKVLCLCKELYKEEPKVIFLDKVISTIQKGEISGINELKNILKSQDVESLGIEEAPDFANELYLIPKRVKKFEQASKRVGKGKKSQK